MEAKALRPKQSVSIVFVLVLFLGAHLLKRSVLEGQKQPLMNIIGTLLREGINRERERYSVQLERGVVGSLETTAAAAEGRSTHRHATQAAICDKSSVLPSKAAQLALPRSA